MDQPHECIRIVWPCDPQTMAARQIDLQCTGVSTVTFKGNLWGFGYLDGQK
jgi:hypothetical protein